MRIKVLVISDYRETQSVRPEAELFIGLQGQGVEVTIMTFGSAPYVERFAAAGIRVIDFHPVSKFSGRETRRIWQELRAGGYDVLHLFNSKAMLSGLRAAMGLPVKVALYRGYTGHIHWYDPTAYLKYLSPRVDGILCIAKSVEESLQQQLFTKEEKAVTIHKGHDLAWYAGILQLDLASELGIPEEAFKVACVANNRPMKGVRYLLEATHHLPTDLPIHFILVGKDMDAGECRGLIKSSPNRDKIHLLGYRTDVLELVAASDAFVLPSIKGEATTKAVIEAMALGVVPVATDIPGNRELVVHERCGLVVPPGDPIAIATAIFLLYNDPALREKLGNEARSHIHQNFNIKNTISETKAWYASLLGRQAGGG